MKYVVKSLGIEYNYEKEKLFQFRREEKLDSMEELIEMLKK